MDSIQLFKCQSSQFIRTHSRWTPAHSQPSFPFIKVRQCHIGRFGLQQPFRLLPPVINLPVSWAAAAAAAAGGSAESAAPVGAATEAQRSIPVVLKGLKL